MKMASQQIYLRGSDIKAKVRQKIEERAEAIT